MATLSGKWRWKNLPINFSKYYYDNYESTNSSYQYSCTFAINEYRFTEADLWTTIEISHSATSDEYWRIEYKNLQQHKSYFAQSYESWWNSGDDYGNKYNDCDPNTCTMVFEEDTEVSDEFYHLVTTFAERIEYIAAGVYEWLTIPSAIGLSPIDENALMFKSNGKAYTHMTGSAQPYPGTGSDSIVTALFYIGLEPYGDACYAYSQLDDKHPAFFTNNALRVFIVDKVQNISAELEQQLKDHTIKLDGFMPQDDSYYPISGRTLNNIRRLIDNSLDTTEYIRREGMAELDSHIIELLEHYYDKEGYRTARDSKIKIVSYPPSYSYDPIILKVENGYARCVEICVAFTAYSNGSSPVECNEMEEITYKLQPYESITINYPNASRDSIHAEICGFRFV